MKELKIEDRITNRSQNIDRYFSELNREELITVDEEYELAVRIQNGDREALNRLVKANLRFVVSVAKQYAHHPDMLGELIAQGNIGLIEAAETFDPSRGFKFISYAVWSIRKEILNGLSEIKTVRLPHHITLDLNRSKKAEASLASQLGRDPSLHEIVDEMHRLGYDMDFEKLSYIRAAQERPIPLEPGGTEEEFTPIHWLESDDSTGKVLSRSHNMEYLLKMLDILKPVEKQIILLRLGIINGDEHSYESISAKYNRSPEWARQVYNIAIRKVSKFAQRRSIL
jgi:RNA polymerase primary sigma factor